MMSVVEQVWGHIHEADVADLCGASVRQPTFNPPGQSISGRLRMQIHHPDEGAVPGVIPDLAAVPIDREHPRDFAVLQAM